MALIVGDFSHNSRQRLRLLKVSIRSVWFFYTAGAFVAVTLAGGLTAYHLHQQATPTKVTATNQQQGHPNQPATTTPTNDKPAVTPQTSKTPSTTKPGSSTGGSSTGGSSGGSGSGSGSGSGTKPNPQTTWAACMNGGVYTPLTDTAAAALVTHVAEVRPYNARPFSINGVSYAAANYYVPTNVEISAFRSSVDPYGHTAVQGNPYMQYVDGRDGLTNPSTDDLIQWAAHKWGIPEDWLRAEYTVETYWNEFAQGDQTTVSASWYGQYPVQSRVPSSSDVYQSLGITQERWAPDGSLGVGSEPLRWKSTAFNIDYQTAVLRYYYDNPNGLRSAWGDGSYVACQQWNSIGGWFNPYPWNNSGQENYISAVQQDLNDRTWTTPGFINYSFTFPALVTFQ